MNTEHLIKMANQIGSFFSTMPDREQAVADLASHLKRFWEPRMRRAFLAHIEQTQGEGVDPIVLEAVSKHMQQLAA
ncbi:formate dehydrogenase subunit delta [Herbaspirillum sp. WKF16]|uniref:formate dehydrogenase subunit delta n=1 Tax=Herbaspirillum sp. WKF16 TaxID=3028312 RepID=UPI0023A99E27|nr:formate dehydrogenase subunit delta [Herbaspirillum sp. WKF16]WDZ94902.1 formate dehydrogenase subunit delta [Herbaspirillum sp. WKF16]